ncbi:uncharacterized protein LOC125675096 [Ostrea edulis]|uniref:uncharacterized protein LOC125675096 n=1 Tax=Ostrea edulis TaxID=37623 RepID=UPI0024AECC87|nr:uncharacterized protein LOC125675096 [Ostrea edulis]
MGLYKVTGFLATIVTSVCYMVSFCAPFWYYIDLGPQEIYGGLWLSCLSNFITKTCSNKVNGSNPGWIHVYQTFGCLALVCVIASLVLAIIYMFLWQLKEWLRKAIICSAFASGIMIFLCVTIFAAKFRDRDYEKEDLSFCFYLAIVGILTSIGTGAVLLVGKTKGD